jgi:hypothetical protein
MYSNFLLNKRRERAEFRIGCRLIAGELDDNSDSKRIMLEKKRVWQSADLLELTTEAWKEHRHVLASYLSYEAWRDVQSAIWAAHHADVLLIGAREAEVDEMDDGMFKALTRLAAEIVKGQTSLRPYLRKPRRRLLDPFGIRTSYHRTTRAGMTR